MDIAEVHNELQILRLDHVAMAAEHIEGITPFLTELFGMEPKGSGYPNPVVGFKGRHFIIPGGKVELEVLEPIGEESYLRDFLRKGGSRLHHLTFHVKDLEVAREALKRRGIVPHSNSRQWEIIIRPSTGHGVFWQLFQYDRRFSGLGDHVPKIPLED